MGKFVVKRRLKLDFLGEGWEDCYIDITPFSPSTLRDILEHPTPDEKTPEAGLQSLDDSQTRLRAAFVAGKGFDGTNVVDLVAEDISELPLEVSEKLRELTMGTLDPNLPTP